MKLSNGRRTVTGTFDRESRTHIWMRVNHGRQMHAFAKSRWERVESAQAVRAFLGGDW